MGTPYAAVCQAQYYLLGLVACLGSDGASNPHTAHAVRIWAKQQRWAARLLRVLLFFWWLFLQRLVFLRVFCQPWFEKPYCLRLFEWLLFGHLLFEWLFESLGLEAFFARHGVSLKCSIGKYSIAKCSIGHWLNYHHIKVVQACYFNGFGKKLRCLFVPNQPVILY